MLRYLNYVNFRFALVHLVNMTFYSILRLSIMLLVFWKRKHYKQPGAMNLQPGGSLPTSLSESS